MRKCTVNLKNGLRPIVVTTQDAVSGALLLAKGAGIDDRLEVLDAQQFLAANIYEWSQFEDSRCRSELERLVGKYNKIVSECESDPSLRIEIG